MSQEITLRDPYKTFEHAIEAGDLTTDVRAPTYAGRYMYMYTQGDYDMFKHTITRKYIQVRSLTSLG